MGLIWTTITNFAPTPEGYDLATKLKPQEKTEKMNRAIQEVTAKRRTIAIARAVIVTDGSVRIICM